MYVPDKTLLTSKTMVRYFCRNIFGIGRERTNLILKIYGLYGNASMHSVLGLFYKKLIGYIDSNFLTEKALSNIVLNKLSTEKNLLSVRGFKLMHKLPINGQRTHTNAGTSKRLGLDYYISSNKERKMVKEKARQVYLIEDSKTRRKTLRKYFKKIKKA